MKYFFLFFTVIRFLHFRQIISNGENMHEMLINSTKNKKKICSVYRPLNLPRVWSLYFIIYNLMSLMFSARLFFPISFNNSVIYYLRSESLSFCFVMLSLHQEFLDRKQTRVLCLLTPGNLNLILHLHFVVWIISS